MKQFDFYACDVQIPHLPDELCLSGLHELLKNRDRYQDPNFMQERWAKIKEQWSGIDGTTAKFSDFLKIQGDKEYNSWVNEQLGNTNPVMYSMQEFSESRPTTIVNDQGVEQAISNYHRVKASQAHYDWVYENIPELKGHVNEVGFQSINNKANHPNGATFAIHTDGNRGEYVLAYNLDVGGPNVHTVWYQEDGQPLIRQPGMKRLSMRNLTKMDEVVFKPREWGMLKANILHTVDSIQTDRIALTIGFSNRELAYEIVEKYTT